MAINPNTDFSAGAVLTAEQMNRLPRGVMSYTSTTTSDATITAEEIQITGGSFTAVANRYYRITYYEPQLAVPATAGAYITIRLRLTNLSGTVYQTGVFQTGPANVVNSTSTIHSVNTFSAGSVTLVASLQCNTGTGSATRSSTQPAFLLVEDIGPA